MRGPGHRLPSLLQPRRRILIGSTSCTHMSDFTLNIKNHRHHDHRRHVRWILSAAVQNRLDTMMRRHEEILQEMNSEGHTQASLGKELSSLAGAVELYRKRLEMDEEETSLLELLQEATASSDADMEQECRDEISRLTRNKQKIEKRIINAALVLQSKDGNEDDDESDAVIEVRAGTGGDEASLFAAELFESYIKTAKAINWKVDILQHQKSEIGGIKEASMNVSGRPLFQIPAVTDDIDNVDEDENDDEQQQQQLMGPYGTFKYESGVHRVQRVPVNDSRIHTSACSVAVLPSIADDDNANDLLPTSELRIETMRAHGAGGQHINTTDSAVRITHIPTGITASIQDERSQQQNRKKALKLIAARVRDLQRAEAERARGETKSSLMGGGDRSERIRTYNFPQDRITDHRCKESRHGIESLLGTGGAKDGLVVTFFPYLRAIQQEELLSKLEEQERGK
jgi:peptide chain release factor 1